MVQHPTTQDQKNENPGKCGSHQWHLFSTDCAVIVLLVWFYIAGFARLIGGEINTVRENQSRQPG